jgi:hypothetical protein
VSVRDQERRQKEAERRNGERMRAADRRVRGDILARQKAADLRANEVVERIEKGGVDPRPLPSLREDSMPSMKSTPSIESSPSMASIESAESVSDVTGEADADEPQEEMPLEGVMPYDAAGAEEDLAERTTEDTGAGGDPHQHNEIKAREMAERMTEDTRAGGDMNLHAERKVEQTGDQMFEG